MSILGHESHKVGKDEWLTPPDLIAALGEFDLDPCAPIKRPWDTAKEHWDISVNGLYREWHGCVWLNPPYGGIKQWMARMAHHGNGVALTFARTETAWFHDHVFNAASAILFLRGRITFHHLNGTKAAASSGAPSVLVAYGSNCVDKLAALNECANIPYSGYLEILYNP